MTSDERRPTAAEITDAQVARLGAQTTVDEGIATLQESALADRDTIDDLQAGALADRSTITGLEAVGVQDRDMIAHLEVDGLADRDLIAVFETAGLADRGTITHLEAAGVVDRALIAQLELEGIIDRDKIANLEVALVTARRIGAAIGIIMVIQKVTEERAFTVLCEASSQSNRKLRDVADAVLTTGTVMDSSPVARPAPPAARGAVKRLGP